MAKGGKNKKPAIAVSPITGKSVRGGSIADNVAISPFKWSTSQIDLDGPFGWRHVPAVQILNEIVPRLHDYEGQTWADIDGKTGSHFIEVHKFCRDARKRLTAIKINDVDQLFSLRINGKSRLWGPRDGAILRILWWDPEHEICPSTLKHT